jgi:hypothetical protein
VSAAALTVAVLGHEIEVRHHALADTGVGIAGFFDALLSDGRAIVTVGRWDDERCGHNKTPWCAEQVWLDDEFTETLEEGSLYVSVGGSEVSVEDIALAIYRAAAGGAA